MCENHRPEIPPWPPEAPVTSQTSVPERPTCPNCGYDFKPNAVKWPCPKCGIQPLEKQVGGRLKFKGSLVAHLQGGTEEAIRVEDDEGRSVAGDIAQTGKLTLSLKANPRPGEMGNPEVCRILVARLNRDGAQWGNCDCQANQDVDCRTSDANGNVLKMQITRAVGDGNIWREIGKAGKATRNQTANEAVKELRMAIDKKRIKLPPAQREDLVLALDAIETPTHGMAQVVHSFRNRHGAWARELGFKAIWVVGPNETLAFRLDD